MDITAITGAVEQLKALSGVMGLAQKLNGPDPGQLPQVQGQRPPQPRRDPSTVDCHTCGERGHWAQQCPNKQRIRDFLQGNFAPQPHPPQQMYYPPPQPPFQQQQPMPKPEPVPPAHFQPHSGPPPSLDLTGNDTSVKDLQQTVSQVQAGLASSERRASGLSQSLGILEAEVTKVSRTAISTDVGLAKLGTRHVALHGKLAQVEQSVAVVPQMQRDLSLFADKFCTIESTLADVGSAMQSMATSMHTIQAEHLRERRARAADAVLFQSPQLPAAGGRPVAGIHTQPVGRMAAVGRAAIDRLTTGTQAPPQQVANEPQVRWADQVEVEEAPAADGEDEAAGDATVDGGTGGGDRAPLLDTTADAFWEARWGLGDAGTGAELPEEAAAGALPQRRQRRSPAARGAAGTAAAGEAAATPTPTGKKATKRAKQA